MTIDDLGFAARNGLYLSRLLGSRTAASDATALKDCLARGGHIDAKDEDGLALIHYAAINGDSLLIRILWVNGANISLLDDGTPPWKPIHYAIFHRKYEAEQVLRSLAAETPLPILKQCVYEKPVCQEGKIWTEKFQSASAVGRER